MPWKRIVPPHAKPTPVLAGAFRVVDQLIAYDADWIVGLGLLHRRILGIFKMRLDGIQAVIAQRRAIAPSDGFVVSKILIGRWIDPAKGNVADAPLGSSQDTVRQRRRQGFEE